MNIQEAKKLDMVEYLSSLGYEPSKKNGQNYWYNSPLHDERTPSFKINKSMNLWYDFAEGKGGNLVDFGVAYHKCSVSDFLQRLDGPGLPTIHPHHAMPLSSHQQDATIQIQLVKPVIALPLIRYLRERRIPEYLAQQHLKQVHYSLNNKKYYALGFANDAGGFELRNQYIKASSSPKGSTFIDQGADRVAVFEGFFDFLSHKKIFQQQDHPPTNYLVLNSASFFDQQLPRMQAHRTVHLYLDNDNTGNKYTAAALALDRNKFQDERKLYQQHQDLNAWCQHIGKSGKLQQKP